jgi:hypothetical protein
MRKGTTKKYFDAILMAYEQNLFYLPIYKLGHFFTRAYSVTGDKKYERILSQFIYIYKPLTRAEIIHSLKNGFFVYSKKNKLSKFSSARQKERVDFYYKNPKTKFFLNLLQFFIYLKKFNLSKKYFSNSYSQLIALLKKEDFKKIFLTEQTMRTNGSYIFNSIYVLKDMDICDISASAIEYFVKIYFKNNFELKHDLSKDEFSSLIYVLTHIVIASSSYYEKFVGKNLWILDFFEKNIARIIQETSSDIIAEVGLCIKLCRKEKEKNVAYKKVIDYLIAYFPFQKLSNRDFLVEKEHTCSILLLLFSKMPRLYKGPDISKSEIFKKYHPL